MMYVCVCFYSEVYFSIAIVSTCSMYTEDALTHDIVIHVCVCCSIR